MSIGRDWMARGVRLEPSGGRGEFGGVCGSDGSAEAEYDFLTGEGARILPVLVWAAFVVIEDVDVNDDNDLFDFADDDDDDEDEAEANDRLEIRDGARGNIFGGRARGVFG